MPRNEPYPEPNWPSPQGGGQGQAGGSSPDRWANQPYQGSAPSLYGQAQQQQQAADKRAGTLSPYFSPGAGSAHQQMLDEQRQAAIQTQRDWAAAVEGGVGGLQQARQAGLQGMRQQAGQALAGAYGGAGGRVAGGGGMAGLRQAGIEHGIAEGQYGAQMQQAIDQQRAQALQAMGQAQAFERQAGTPYEDMQQTTSWLTDTWLQIRHDIGMDQANEWLINNVNMFITDPQLRASILQMAGIGVSTPGPVHEPGVDVWKPTGYAKQE